MVLSAEDSFGLSVEIKKHGFNYGNVSGQSEVNLEF